MASMEASRMHLPLTAGSFTTWWSVTIVPWLVTESECLLGDDPHKNHQSSFLPHLPPNCIDVCDSFLFKHIWFGPRIRRSPSKVSIFHINGLLGNFTGKPQWSRWETRWFLAIFPWKPIHWYQLLLVGGIQYLPLWKMMEWVTVGMMMTFHSQHMESHKKFLKPPTSDY